MNGARRTKWKRSLYIGGCVGIVPLFAGLVMFGVSPGTVLSRLAYLLFALGMPGLLLEAIVMREPHGGGTPLEMLLLVMPLNIIFYTLLSYIAITLIDKVRGLRRR